MKYTYAYKTSDGTRHEAAMVAESREAVFAALRAQGIKAIKVVAADGSKANGEIRGVRKRVLVASVIGAAVLAGLVVYFAPTTNRQSPITDFLSSQTRRQIVGDAAIVEKGIKDGWADVFADEGERFLASFAIPGVPAGQRNTTEDEIRAALSRKVEAVESDSIEVRQIKAMVEGMKNEARHFIEAGGTIAAYGRKLVRRQEEEISYYCRAKAEIENAHKSGMPQQELSDLWEKRNTALRQMGVKLVPLPE